MRGRAHPGESTAARVTLLAGQAFALGLTLSWVLIPASAIFLIAYGSELLPLTYIASGALGVASSVVLTRASRHCPLVGVARTTLLGTATLLLLAFAVLSVADASWISFALLALVPMIVPVGFIFIVGQAGMLLDVRALKASYARVVAGFAFGSVVGGLLGAPLLRVIPTEGLLVVATLAVFAFLVLVEMARRRHPSELAVVERREPSAARPTLRVIAGNRFVLLLATFQMLSAVESQWLDFHVFASAADRYPSSESLARFVSGFSAIAYGADILFLLLAAGLLLRRFGLRFGLTANSVGVLVLVLAVIATTSALGSGASVVFVLVVAARVTDLTLSDGASRTSLSAAYQAVPGRLRGLAQATVEGLAVPVAIGASGVVLLLIQGRGGLLLPVLTAIVVTAWVVVAFITYRAYRVSLLAGFRGRILDPSDLTLDDEGSIIAIDRLVQSGNERDVRLGLEILTLAHHPQLTDRLQRLLIDDRVGVRTDALERLVPVDPTLAAEAARASLADAHPAVRAVSIRVLGHVGDPSDRPAVDAHWSDPDPEVCVAVGFALSRMGGNGVHATLAHRIVDLLQDDDDERRRVGVRMLGAVDPAVPIDRTILRTALADRCPDVVTAALDAFRSPDDDALLSLVVARLEWRDHRRAAIDALVRAGDTALELIDAGLRDPAADESAQEHLVRVARDIGSPPAVALLRGHVDHRDRAVGLAVMRALAVVEHTDGSSASTEAMIQVIGGVAIADLEYAARVLQALAGFEHEPAAASLCRALADELDLLAARVLVAFSIRGEAKQFERIMFQLEQPDARSHALALEWLDVTLTGSDRALVAILEPHATHRDRLRALGRWLPVTAQSRDTILLDIAHDPDDRWRRPWLAACALFTAVQGSDAELAARVASSDDWPVPLAQRAGIVQETLDGLRARRTDLVPE